jgi:hypothetical protein
MSEMEQCHGLHSAWMRAKAGKYKRYMPEDGVTGLHMMQPMGYMYTYGILQLTQ